MITPMLTNAYPPAVVLDWPMFASPALIFTLVCAAVVATVAWRILGKFESAPRRRQGARIHALDRAA